jgi:hypothetical protein
MPFLLPALPAIIGGIGATTGLISSVSQGNRQNKAIQSQLDIAKAEEARRQAIYDKLVPFFSSYLQSGSPFLSQIQRAGAEQTATGANNAAGQIRQTLGTSGLGFGPSGATAAALGGLGAETGRTASSNYLTNLLNNEMVRFQAAQGISGLNTGPQLSPQPGQYPINPIPGAIGSFGTALSNLLKQIPTSAGPAINNKSPAQLGIPAPGTVPTSPMPFPPWSTSPSSSPTTEGFGWGF